jgi:hypothetical protein
VPGVFVTGVGNSVTGTVIRDAPHLGIGFAGNDHLFERNIFRRLVRETGDAGAIYTGRDWTARGTVIRHNLFEDIVGVGERGGTGVYLDDQASGIRVEGNVFHRVHEALHVGGGRANELVGNLVLDAAKPLHFDARGLNWQRAATLDPNDTLQTRLRAVPYDRSPWRERYPDLPAVLTDRIGQPLHNVIRDNVVVGQPWPALDPSLAEGQIVEGNVSVPSPLAESLFPALREAQEELAPASLEPADCRSVLPEAVCAIPFARIGPPARRGPPM